MTRSACLLAPLLFGFAACAVGPDYREPAKIAVATDWIEPGVTTPVSDAWWESFADPVLTKLLAAASTRNLDIRAAQARLVEARASRDVARRARLPQLNASAAATTNRLSENGQIPIGSIPGFARDLDLYDVGFDASWEINLWGRARRTAQGASARAEAAAAEQRNVLLSLRAEIARTYVDLRSAQTRLTSLQLDADAQAKIALLTQQRFAAGEVARFDADRAEGLARATAAQLPELQGEVTAAAYRLTLLVGNPPEAVDPVLLSAAPIPQTPDRIAIGLRSDLLRRRPDIVAAERRLAAATADVGVATADLFPRIALLGSLGQQARTAGDLTDGASTRYSLGPSFSWPIFDRGRIHAAIRGAGARSEGAAIGYEAAVLGALHDSETAANRFARATEALAQSRAALEAQHSALELARERYRAGEADLIELLSVESSYASTQRATTDAEAARAIQAIALFKALGGGAGV
jgi:NodT family efflux transporter outer membrane factor (OMF) lipoprotein